MPKAYLEKIVDVTADQFFKAVSSFENYPKFVDGMKKAKIIKKEGHHYQVQYVFSFLFKEITYSLDLRVDPKKLQVSWNLLDSDFFSSNQGSWSIEPLANDKAKVKYKLEGDFKIPVPDSVVNKLIQSTMPGLVKSIEKFAKKI